MVRELNCVWRRDFGWWADSLCIPYWNCILRVFPPNDSSPHMKTTKLLWCALSVAAALGSTQAGAQTIQTELIDISPFVPVTGTLNDGLFIQEYTSGVMNFEVTDPPGIGSFTAFCVDPLQDIAYGDTPTYQVQDLSTLAFRDEISRLVGGYFESSRTNLDAAAVHWAIWEIVGETNESFRSTLTGNVRITSSANADVAALANDYLQNINSFAPANLVYLVNPTQQDVVSWTPSVLPEPSSLMFLGLSAFGLLRRRR